MLHRHKSLFVTCVFLFALVEYAEAQRTVPIHFEIGLNEHVGKLIKIHGEYPPSKLATLTEVSLLWQRFQPYDWQQGYGFPAYGFSLVHAQFGNQDVLGQSIAAIPMMRFDRWKGFTRYSLKAGFGLAWFNKPYDAQNNPENLVIGSRFTNMSMLRTDVTTQFSDRCTASIGLSFTHCSNSHFAVPNIGANIVAVHAGLAFHNRRGVLQLDESVYSNPSSFPKRRYMWWYSLHSILGFHEAIGTIRPVDGPRYPVYGIGLFGNKKIAHRIYAVGVNYHYYPYMHDYIISQELFDASLAKRNAQTVVVFAGFEWEFGR
ncbi:MAG: acyloxyacyl hydrolase, partial [Flavobacteriales bacterium]